MKTLITTLNSKYIHTSLSLRLLYVSCYKKHDIDFYEYTIKDSIKHIVEDILSRNLDVVAFSCYIWNIELIKDICTSLKQEKPEIIIIFGGPEVGYDVTYFLDNFDVDYVLSGEGEQSLELLLSVLEKQQEVNIDGVSYQGHVSDKVPCVDLSYIETLDSPYRLEQDKKHKKNRILYFESSRGCPFQCQYCLSSLENGLRFFSEDYLKQELKYICESDVRIVKFLDRSFNANVKHAIMILETIVKYHQPGQQFQFEINADVLAQPILDYIHEQVPQGLIRFEIGIQSTYEKTNKAVKRIQNYQRLSEVVNELMLQENVDLHLDLIAGLPYEDYSRFKQSFDDVFMFKAKELQLGFLKLLRGTSLRHDADDYGYIYDTQPPYEMIENKWLSKEDIENIHLAEDMLEKYWNSGRFVRTMNEIMDNISSPFDFFYQLGVYYKNNNCKVIGYQLDELFLYLDQYLNDSTYHELLILDYLHLFKVKPKRWYKATLTTNQRKETIKYLSELYQLDQELLFRYALIEKFEDCYVVAIYKDMNVSVELYKEM